MMWDKALLLLTLNQYAFSKNVTAVQHFKKINQHTSQELAFFVHLPFFSSNVITQIHY